MLELKTHFEQVPMEVVRKIVEEQIRREITTEQDRGIEKKTLEEDLLEAQEHQWRGPAHFRRRSKRGKP